MERETNNKTNTVININGDTPDTLLGQFLAIYQGIENCKTIIRRNMPHGRNFNNTEEWKEEQDNYYKDLQVLEQMANKYYHFAQQMADRIR